MRGFLLITGLLLLFAVEILRVYFIMPFPGSQQSNTIDVAYWLGKNITWLRILGLSLVLWPSLQIFLTKGKWKKIFLAAALLLYVVIFFFINFRFEADKMFYQPQSKIFASGATNKIADNKLVIGVAINGEAKAYPIQLIGYHHQVRDTIGNTPVMITYCTVCRTGRAFSPFVNGKPEDFRLVGMDHFNAMFEDATTKSWWQQATGVAVAGPLKGKALQELPSQQLTLAAWLSLHPNSTVMQPDTLYQKDYDDLADYDKGTIKSSLEKRDSSSWKFKSWVIGVAYNNNAKAYDWNKLVETSMIQDSMPGLPIIITLEKDTASFHVFSRSINGTVLQFEKNNDGISLRDINTQSIWNMQGACIDGMLKGQALQPVQSSQEFWHSWSTFHPATEKYEK
ncbi:DUF3179 domain-containing protein [Panacibacter ginsenosidivorans]|uniref:DUF3179 domain-containing protein n=1 Tax=Panacibacter ginsenosidivorans TaxID=1813871 RepID=A0A5B8VDC4_9BACT|nr:DUF3179 domain-containing (seleno)protein [Panacibacter ginsenosidivorans]QEC68646.1 DUF3179 domain-containing protein [Panacibacter ginsenosidivorans]